MRGNPKYVIQIRTILITLVVSFYQIGFTGELTERRIIQNEVIEALKYNDFDKVEKISKKYRKQTIRTSSGLYPLTFFYLGITNYSGWSTNYPDSVWLQHKLKNEKWIKQFPESPTAYIAQVILYEQLAYSYRVSNNGRIVTPENMRISEKLMKRAYAILIKSKAIAAKDPHWYVEMIRVATGLGWEDKKYMLLVEEAVKKFPVYYQIYFAAVDYYSPRFGGNLGLMEKFARFAVKHTKNKLGMSLYARIYWAALQSWPSERVLKEINWNDFKLGIDTVLSRYPDEWNTNNFAYFACLAGDKDKASELIAKINDLPIVGVWGNKQNFQRCKSAVGLNDA